MATVDFGFFAFFMGIALVMFGGLVICELLDTFRDRKKEEFYKQTEIPVLENSVSVEDYIKSIDGLKPLNKTKCNCSNSVCVANLSCICGNVKVKWDVYLIEYYIRDKAFLGTQIVNQSGNVISFKKHFKEIDESGIRLDDDTTVWVTSSGDYFVTSQPEKRFGQ